ncbi:SusD/RagB family nutrient-binding outer membrane lipoprotein [Leeuwenhoekiella sp. H156]|uniref:SusD/RagB family nutrient-binding outer membrane lipoprotein n=1 Tax=Leeuwenhoekiella sp. H156 TaxID=3450128 RepID=UPI003FA43B73
MKFKYIILVLTLALFSCESYVDELNDDPNQPTSAGVANIIQGVQLSNQFWQTAAGPRTTMLWLNQATGADRQYIALNDWNTAQSTIFDGTWNEAMVGTISQAQVLKDAATLSGAVNVVGLAQVIEANAFGTLTSLFGDIPFSQVNKFEEFPNPEYESQAEVYNKIQTLLDEAIDNLETPSSGIPDNDLVYGGDVDSWIELAYTLKARYYLHVGNYPMAISSANRGISSAEGDYMAKFGTVFGASFNPFYDFLVYNRPGYMSADAAYAPRLLDPSSSIYRGNSKTNESARFAFNYITDEIYNDGYELNFLSIYDWGYPDGKFGTESDMPLASYGENLLILAEAQARQNGFDAGLTAYNNYRAVLDTGYSIGTENDGYAAVEEPFNYEAYIAADFAPGGMENQDNIDQTDALLREIMEERYIYFNGNYESFIDLTRTSNEAGIVLKSGYSGIPARFLYPQVEINSNSNTPSPIPGITQPTPIYQ